MFKIIDGLQGSGKSYYATHHIYTKKDKYHKIYTNINEFNFNDNVYPLNWNNTLEILMQCKEIYNTQIANYGSTEIDNALIDKPILDYLIEKDVIKKNDKYDDYLIKLEERNNLGFFAKLFKDYISPITEEIEYYATLLVIDEAHNNWANKNDLLTWFITYHRHLHFDVILITQTYSLIHYSYHKLVQTFIHALPSDRQLVSAKFKYQNHVSVPFRNEHTLTSNEYLLHDKKIFAMYKSGDKVRSKSVVKKYLIYFILFAISAVVGLFLILDIFFNIGGDDEKLIQPIEHNKPISQAKSQNVYSVVPVEQIEESLTYVQKTKLKYLVLYCTIKECSNKEFNLRFDYDILGNLITETNSKILKTDRTFKHTTSITILATETFLDLFSGVPASKKTSNNLKLF